MTMMHFAVGEPPKGGVVERAVERLVQASQVGDGFLISLPMFYPTGTAVGIRIEPAEGGFYVSDFAMGYREAEDFGAERSFRYHVGKLIEGGGAEFTTGKQVRIRATEAQIKGAIIKVASISRDAAVKAYENAADWDDEELAADLFQRLTTVFGTDHVIARALKTGASSVQWKFAAKVQLEGREILFDAVSPHHNSVFSAVSKFNDVLREDDQIEGVAVVDDKNAMGKWLPLLSQTAIVIEDDASEDTLRHIARVA